MSTPHIWLREQIESTTEIPTYPVEVTRVELPPYIVYVRDETQRDVALTLGDTLNSPIAEDLSLGTFAVTIYADSYVQAWEIAGAISGALHNVSGGEGSTYIQQSRVASQRDGAAGYLEGRDQPTYTVEMTIQIWFEE